MAPYPYPLPLQKERLYSFPDSLLVVLCPLRLAIDCGPVSTRLLVSVSGSVSLLARQYLRQESLCFNNLAMFATVRTCSFPVPSPICSFAQPVVVASFVSAWHGLGCRSALPERRRVPQAAADAAAWRVRSCLPTLNRIAEILTESCRFCRTPRVQRLSVRLLSLVLPALGPKHFDQLGPVDVLKVPQIGTRFDDSAC